MYVCTLTSLPFPLLLLYMNEQALRVVQGRPFPDKELTAEVTPLEAGLYHTVHLEKGCYLGQETIAKVCVWIGMDYVCVWVDGWMIRLRCIYMSFLPLVY